MALSIRVEAPQDFERVRQINEAAFDSPAEANIVEELRRSAEPIVSLVAETAGEVYGHIVFSPVTIDDADVLCFGLGPMAVVPERQRSGIGSWVTRLSIRGSALSPHPNSASRLTTTYQMRYSWPWNSRTAVSPASRVWPVITRHSRPPDTDGYNSRREGS